MRIIKRERETEERLRSVFLEDGLPNPLKLMNRDSRSSSSFIEKAETES